jgi:hypothetical protein
MGLEKILNFYRNGFSALSLGNEPLPIVKAKMWYFMVKLGRVKICPLSIKIGKRP